MVGPKLSAANHLPDMSRNAERVCVGHVDIHSLERLVFISLKSVKSACGSASILLFSIAIFPNTTRFSGAVPVDATPLCAPLAELHPVDFCQVRRTEHEALFGALLQAHHYLKQSESLGIWRLLRPQ